MKKIFFILIFILAIVFVRAQSPDKMSYQAVIRNTAGKLITDTQIKIRISILRGSADGMQVYTEIQVPTTNANGLVSLEIGEGTVVSGDFALIDWSDGPYFIKTETDPSGGANYTITGTTQLLSVPYAFYAKTAENINGTIPETDPVFGSAAAADITPVDIESWNNKLDSYTETDPVFAEWDKDYYDLKNKPDIVGIIHSTADGSETKLTAGTDISITGTGTVTDPYIVNSTFSSVQHSIGELYGGGIVFYTYDNGHHGLIASPDDLGSGAEWGGVSVVIPDCYSPSDGAANTEAIVARLGAGTYAAGICDAYSGGGQNDWYLPASWELNLLFDAAYLISSKLDNDGDDATNGLTFTGFYWSSTATLISSNAWLKDFSTGEVLNNLKNKTYGVRAVRRF